MSLRKITAGFAILAALVFVGCDDDSTSSTSSATKIDSGKWVPVSSTSTTIETTTSTAAGLNTTVADTTTDSETYTDTTEILTVTDNSITYYVDDIDSTIVISFGNDFAGEFKKVVNGTIMDL